VTNRSSTSFLTLSLMPHAVRRGTALWLGVVLCCGLPLLPALGAARPNLFVILTDDHGVGDVSAYRKADVQTPHLDRLASQGMRFNRMRANATVCSPSRAALLTGKYPDRVGVPGVIRTRPEDSWGWFDPRAATLPDLLRRFGYHTALVGKWHLGLKSPNTPNERGFEFFHGFLGDMLDSYTTHEREGHNYLRRNAQPITPKGHATDLFTDWAVDYLEERASCRRQPFFLMLAYTAPHFPIEPPEAWLARVQKRDSSLSVARARNVALVEHLDHGIGRVLDRLDALGLGGNTVVVFTSDNGGSLPHGQSNAPWRDGKQSHYDGGLRVPFLVRWTGVVTPYSQSDYAGLTFDIFPTFLELAGVQLPSGLDAVSLVPILQGKSMPAGRRDLYFARREGGRYGGNSYEALIRGRWKLLRNDPYSPFELYDLDSDPIETKNVAGQYPDRIQELSEALREHVRRGGQVPWQPPSDARTK
jgi:arylsulfatase A-like enzyme